MNLVHAAREPERPAPRALLLRKGGFIILQSILGLFALVFLFPGLLSILDSFKTNAEIKLAPLALPTRLSFANYINAWREMNFPAVLLNTLLITVLSTAGIILISSMAAYVLVVWAADAGSRHWLHARGFVTGSALVEMGRLGATVILGALVYAGVLWALAVPEVRQAGRLGWYALGAAWRRFHHRPALRRGET